MEICVFHVAAIFYQHIDIQFWVIFPAVTHTACAIDNPTQENRYGFPTLMLNWQDINDIKSFRTGIPNDLRVINGPRKTNKKDKDSRHLLGVNSCVCTSAFLWKRTPPSNLPCALQYCSSGKTRGLNYQQGTEHRHCQEP
jgi:hypothetical protein